MKKQYENNIRKGGIAEEIAILKQRREARKAKEEKKNTVQSSGQKKNEQDQKFLKMITKKKEFIFQNKTALTHIDSSDSKIFVVVRKRPIFQKEINNGEIDCISVVNPRVYIHECKIQIDGITKYLEEHEFYFDGTFGENDNTLDLYNVTLAPMIELILNQGIVTCFAYGQTGSGKTYTMKGLEKEAIDDLYNENEKMGDIFDFYISFFEIYNGILYDLLNNKNRVEILDDKNGKVHIYGLYNQIAETPEIMHHIIDSANAIRTTHNTVTNETSSRSHAICNIVVKLKNSDEEYGKLSLVDLAGSERAQETKSNDKERRAEGAEINKSLLALKECIRALDEKKTNPDQHVPFRASKLTHVLRDSFVSKNDKSRIIMISCIMPSYKCSNHSLNTLRYSDRLKEKTKQHFGGNYNNININARGVNSNHIAYNNINSNIRNSYNSNINYNNNKMNLGNNNNLAYQKRVSKENISQYNRIKNNSNKINNNINSAINNNDNNILNNKIKKDNIKRNNIPLQKSNNDTKKNTYKKSDIPRNKNNYKYEDKFCMMDENDIDIEKRNKYTYNNNYDDNIKNNNEESEKSYKNEDENDNENDDEKDWNYVQKLEEKENENNDENEIIDKYYNNDEDEEIEENITQEDNNDLVYDYDYKSNNLNNEAQIEEELNKIGEDIINTHLNTIREAANILSQEGDLVTNIKGVGKLQNFTIEEYISGLENIVDKKLGLYGGIKVKITKFNKISKAKNGKHY